MDYIFNYVQVYGLLNNTNGSKYCAAPVRSVLTCSIEFILSELKLLVFILLYEN
jgi:hypothetical protein